MERNLGGVDRAVRGSVGAIVIVIGGVTVGGLTGVVLGLVGVLLVLSAVAGFCHVYRVFHICTLKGAESHEK